MYPERRILPPPTDQYDALVAWMSDTLAPETSLLEIGAGPGDAAYQERLAGLVGRWIGVDPDPSVAGNPHLTGSATATAEEWHRATDPSDRFDAALSVYVVEHVDRPDDFFRAVHDRLRPGGSFFFLTPNLWHYFGMAALVAHRLGVEDRLLERLRGSDVVQEYHFPVRYRCNAVPSIHRAAERSGFRRMEVRHLDHPGVFEGYFPAALQGFPRRWSSMVHRHRLGRLMGTLLVRLEA